MTRLLPTLLLLLAPLGAQLPVRQTSPLGDIATWSASEHDRDAALVSTVLPLAPGTYREPAPLSIAGQPVQAVPLGLRWPDGSVRYLRIAAILPVAGQQTVRHAVSRGIEGVEAQPFAWHAAILASPPRIMLAVGERAAGFGALELLEAGPVLRAYRSRERIAGTPAWAELTLEVPSGLPYIRWWLAYGYSDDRDPGVVWKAERIRLQVVGCRVVVRHAGAKVRSTVEVEGGVQIELMGAHTWGDGQAQYVTGSLLWDPAATGDEPGGVAAEAEAAVLAVATGWRESGAFGPWGHLPELPEPVDEARALELAEADAARHRDGDPWIGPLHGAQPTPGSTGDQEDFGATVMHLEASGWPARLHSIQRSVYQESCRPTHLRERDASPVRFSSRPDVLLWGGRPDHRITRDKLGKADELALWDLPRNSQGLQWWGHDRQHFSINYLATYALLTGDRLALAEVDHLAELWLGEMRVRSGSPVLDSMGAPRAVGRTLQAGSLLLLATGREDLRRRIEARVTRTDEQWLGAHAHPVRPLGIVLDPRKLGGRYPAWMPWQEGIGARGLDAVAHVTGSELAGRLAAQVAETVTRYGTWQDSGGWTAGDAVRWLDGGVELPAAAYADGTQTEGYRGFLLWVAPALQVAARSDDAGLAARAREVLDAALDGSWDSREWVIR